MKRSFMIIFATVLLVSVSLPLAAASQLKFEAEEIDIGEVESGKIVDVEFKFENAGDSILIIKHIAASCGCTAAKLEKKKYEPGEKGTISVKFNTRGVNGNVTKTLTISSNDKTNVYTKLKIKGKITLKYFATIEVVPDRIEFNEVTLGKKYSKKIKIINGGTIDLRIIEVTHSPDIWPEFTKKIVRPNEEIEVNVVFKPMQVGKIATFLKIRSNSYKPRMMVLVKVSADIKEK